MKTPLSDASISVIYENGKKGREAWRRGEFDRAEAFFLAAWDVLPEPRTDYDYAQSMSGGIVSFYRDTGQFVKARKWLEVMRSAYGPTPNDYVEFVAATVYHDAGELDAAFSIFDGQFKKFRSRPFEGEDKKYINFYKKRAAGG